MNYEVLRVLNRIRGVYASYQLSTESKKNIDEAIDRLMQVYVEILFNDTPGETVLERINSSGNGSSNNYFNVQPISGDGHCGVYALLAGLQRVYDDNKIIDILKTTLENVSRLVRKELPLTGHKAVYYSLDNVRQFREALYEYANQHGLEKSTNLKSTNGGKEIWLTDDDFLVAAKMFNVCIVIIHEDNQQNKVDKRVLHPNLSLAVDGYIGKFHKKIDVTTCEKTIYIGHREEGTAYHWELLIPTEQLNEQINAERLNPPHKMLV